MIKKKGRSTHLLQKAGNCNKPIRFESTKYIQGLDIE